MVYWNSFRALSMHGMLPPINPQHTNLIHCWISSYSYPYYQDKFRRLFLSIDHRHYHYLIRPKDFCSLTFIWVWYTKFSEKNCNTSQLLHSWTKIHWDTTHSTFPSAYIFIIINSIINSCCTPPCTIYNRGIRNCISSKGVSTRTTITSKNLVYLHHQTIIIFKEANIIQTTLKYYTIRPPLKLVYSSLTLTHTFHCFGKNPQAVVWLSYCALKSSSHWNEVNLRFSPYSRSCQVGNSFSKHIGILAQGVGTHMKIVNWNIFFIPINKVRSGRNVTY